MIYLIQHRESDACGNEDITMSWIVKANSIEEIRDKFPDKWMFKKFIITPIKPLTLDVAFKDAKRRKLL